MPIPNQRYSEGMPGTVGYIAPEKYKACGWSHEVDVYAVGCALVSLYIGEELWNPRVGRSEGWIFGILGYRDLWSAQDQTGTVVKLGEWARFWDFLKPQDDDQLSFFVLVHELLVKQPSERTSVSRALRCWYLKEHPL